MAREILLLLLLMEAAAMAALLCDSSVCFGLYRDEYVNLSLIDSALFFLISIYGLTIFWLLPFTFLNDSSVYLTHVACCFLVLYGFTHLENFGQGRVLSSHSSRSIHFWIVQI